MTSGVNAAAILHMDTTTHSKFGGVTHGNNNDLTVVDSSLYMPPNEIEKVKKIKNIVNHMKLVNHQRTTS